MACHVEGRARFIRDRLRSLQVTDGANSAIGRLRTSTLPEIALRIASANHTEFTDDELRNFVVNFSIRNPSY